MIRGILIAAALTSTAILLASTASATPDDPYGNDYVAMAVSPATGNGGYGSSGTLDGAVAIAVQQCELDGSTCVVAASIQYGCVAYALNPDYTAWAGGKGPDAAAASADALSGMPDGHVMATHCSKPLARP